MEPLTPNLVPASLLLAEPRPAWLTRWGEFASGLSWEELSGPLVKQTKLVILDCIGAIAAGMQEAETKKLAARLAARHAGRHSGPGAPAIGAGLRLRGEDAAFVNGVAGTMLELDEGNSFARGHPGIHVLPAALAVRPAAEMSRRDFLLGFVLGYEIGARVGASCRLRPSVHPHGTWGTIGAAVAAAYLDGAGAGDLIQTINVSSSLAVAPSLRTMLEGATVRNAFAGFSARNGIAAWDLVASGFTGEIDGPRSVYGGILGEGFAPEAMVDELGARWEIERNYFKRHAACRFNHGTLDVVARLLADKGPIDPSSVSSIEVKTYSLAAQLDGKAPGNMLAAKFSVPFCVATMLHHGEASVEAFRGAALANQDIRALAMRVSVEEDPAMTAMLPAKRPASVIIRMQDGREIAGETFTNRGDAADPYSEAEIGQKFMSLATPVWGEAHAQRIRAGVDALGGEGDLRELDALLAEPARGEE